RWLDGDRVSRGIDHVECVGGPELPHALDALIEGRTERRIDQLAVDAQHAVEVGGAEYQDAPVHHQPFLAGRGPTSPGARPIRARFRPPRDVDYTRIPRRLTAPVGLKRRRLLTTDIESSVESLDHPVDNAPVRTLQHRNLTIEGYSRAAVQSYWRVPE